MNESAWPSAAALALAALALGCVDQPAPAATPTAGTSAQREAARVVRVVDGDTIHVEIGGSVHAVRYIGVDTPETVDPRRAVERFGLEGAEANRRLVEGKEVLLERDVSERDPFGRLLRYVYVETVAGLVMVNAELVRLGYAHAVTYPPDVRHGELFLALEREAREAGRGLWAPTSSGAPTPGSQ